MEAGAGSTVAAGNAANVAITEGALHGGGSGTVLLSRQSRY